MIEIKKASAGSGKTYQLAKTYLECLRDSGDEHAYRHILAVTFTNKATGEMKARILQNLTRMGEEGDAWARRMLVSILHDYGAFSVSTIDKFFQQAMKAFSRELGYFADYQIELDRSSLVNEAVDRMLDGLTEEDKDLRRYLNDAVLEQLSQGRRLRLEEDLYRMCGLLKARGIDPGRVTKEHLAEVRARCRREIDSFEKAVRELDPAYAGSFPKGDKIAIPKPRYLKASEPAFQALFGERYKIYNTCHVIHGLTFSLGVAREFFANFDALVREKNVMCLDDSNTFLKRIIDGSDAPFVYEKLGVRYEHFLLDEFQDTSNVQWANLYPLLKESDANHHRSLVVGDVKQSIYRWRDSDWNLLATRLKAQFPDAVEETLGCNYRSTAAVVGFNNAFFEYAGARLGLGALYGHDSVHQEVKARDPQPGSVEIVFCEKDAQMDEIVRSIARVCGEQGARYSDIAILVRKNDTGAQIAGELIARGYPVVTDDSLDTKASVIVRRLIALLSCMENEQNAVSRFLASSLGVSFPDHFHSLVDLCEGLLRDLQAADPGTASGEVLHIQSFMDCLQDWVSQNGNNLMNFLHYWKDASVKISSPGRTDSIRIMTIHKSKGLEFPYVIFPYADKVPLYHEETKWCAFEGDSYPVRLTSDMQDSLFAEDYRREYMLQTVDNLNVFYVAFTRAEKGLKVISEKVSGACEKAAASGKDFDFKKMSQVLYHFTVSHGFSYGKPYDFSRMERVPAEDVSLPAGYPSVPVGERLSITDDSSDFFSEDGVGTQASPRLNGVVLHGILSQVSTAADLDGAVRDAFLNGYVDEAEAEQDRVLLAGRIAEHPDWFSEGLRVVNEGDVIGPDGRLWRPDRVVRGPAGTVIIDYKFGEARPSYVRQVQQYIRLYRQMGHERVSGFLWYVRTGEVVPVSDPDPGPGPDLVLDFGPDAVSGAVSDPGLTD